MPRITYLSDGNRTLEAEAGQTLLQSSLSHGLPHTHLCGGQGRCSTCRVAILEGLGHCEPRGAAEGAIAVARNFAPEIRLACQTRIRGDVVLRRLVLDELDVSLVAGEPQGCKGGGGQERTLAILFADIRGFTAFSEGQLPYDVVHVLNRYFQAVSPCIEAVGGRVDNYMGDGLLALFGVGGEEDPAGSAVRAGLAMLTAVEHLNPYMEAQFGTQLRIGLGVHLGEAVLGAVGAGERRRLTAIGDAVNLASRIEGATKEVGATFLLSEQAFAAVSGWVRAGRRFELPLRGKTGLFRLVEVLRFEEGPAAP